MTGHPHDSNSDTPSGRERGRSCIRVHLVEDNPGDARLIRELLREARATGFDLSGSERLDAALAALARQEYDVILLDLTLPDSHGFETFTRTREVAPDLPIVVLTGLDDEDLALKAVREGAQDYLVKGRVDPDLLERVIRYSIERFRIQQELQDLNANLEQRVEERTRELSEAYKALAKANEDLRALDRMKSAFITVTSHELRTPLTAICGMLPVLHEKLSARHDDLLRCARPALRAAQRLERHVVRTLELVEKGQYERKLEIEPVDVPALVAEAVDEVAPFVELRNQKLTTEIPGDLPPANVDGDKIQDVLVNLLMNAIKFTPDEGKIAVGVRRLEEGWLEFRVQDTGIGIPKEDQPHVFEEFFTTLDTLDHSSGEYQFEKRGLGLGLAIVKKFVEMHGGTVGLKSAPGKGSTFQFQIPAGGKTT